MVRGGPASAAGSPTPAKTPVPPFPSAAGTVKAAAIPAADMALADFRQRSAQLMEPILQNLCQGAEEIVADALRRFQDRIEGIVAAAEARVNERSDQAFAELESALATFRADVGDELTARTEQVVEATEKALRSKVAELSRAVDKSGPALAPSRTSDPASRP